MPKPYYQDDAVEIWLGSAVEILDGLPACFTVDAFICDPPFGVKFSRATWSDDPEAYPMLIKWIVEKSTRTCPDGWVFLFQGMPNVGRFAEWFPEGFRLLAACKNFVQMRPTEIQYAWDPVVFWKNGQVEKKHRSDAGFVTRDFHVGDVAGALSNRAGHPCPRPVDTMRHIVGLGSRPGQMILDPFMGSGTTLRAAKDLGRRAIGIEIEEKYCEIAARRMAQEVLPL